MSSILEKWPVEAAGEGNLFLFGLTSQQVAESRGWYNPHWHCEHDPETRAPLDMISSDYFSRNGSGVFTPSSDTLLHAVTSTRISRISTLISTRTGASPNFAPILNVAASGQFSSERAIAECSSEIWHLAPCPVP